MPDFYLKSGSGVVERINLTPYVVGDRIVIARADVSANYLVVRKWAWECTTLGTSGAAVPAWPAAVTQDVTTVVDGTVTWTARKYGFSSGATANWTFAGIYGDYVASAVDLFDRVFAANTHSEANAAAITILFPGSNRLISVSDAAAPPTTRLAGALISTTGANNLTVNGSFFNEGVSFRAGSTGAASLVIASSAYNQRHRRCTLENGSPNSGGGLGYIIFNSNGGNGEIVLEDVNLRFNPAVGQAQGVVVSGHRFTMKGGSITSSTANLTSVFLGGNSYSLSPLLSGVDFSTLQAGVNVSDIANQTTPGNGTFILRDCKMPVGWNGQLALSQRSGYHFALHNSDGAATLYRLWTEAKVGSVKHETVNVRTGGWSDGVTPLSWRMASSVTPSYPLLSLASPEIYSEYNLVVGVPVTLTVEILHDTSVAAGQGLGAAFAFREDEIWLEVLQLGTVGFPLGIFVNDAPADVLTTPLDQTTSTAAWTTTGMTTPVKQKLSVTFTPQHVGPFICVVHLAAINKVVTICPKVEQT